MKYRKLSAFSLLGILMNFLLSGCSATMNPISVYSDASGNASASLKSTNIPEGESAFSIGSQYTRIAFSRLLIFHNDTFYDVATQENTGKTWNIVFSIGGSGPFMPVNIYTPFLGIAEEGDSEIIAVHTNVMPDQGQLFFEIKLFISNEKTIFLYLPVDSKTAQSAFPLIRVDALMENLKTREMMKSP